jgi:hypothetical protein
VTFITETETSSLYNNFEGEEEADRRGKRRKK